MDRNFPSDYLDLYDHMALCQHKLKMCLHYIGEECERLGEKNDPGERKEAAMWIYMLHEIAMDTLNAMLPVHYEPIKITDKKSNA